VPFRQQDLTRALRGAIAAGVPVQRVEIDNTGKIVIILHDDPQKRLDDEIDREIAEFEARHGGGASQGNQ
jgi:hypothetical protein